MPNLLKVGFSTKDPESRAYELHTTEVPHRYIVEYDALVNEPRDVEQKAHVLLKTYHEDKEWFRCDIKTAIIAIRQAANSSIILQSNNDDLIPNENEPLTDPIVPPDQPDIIINRPRGKLTPTRLFQVEFWEQLCNFAVSSKAPLIPRNPTRPQYYCDIRITGRSDCYISMLVERKKNQISCQLYIPKDKALFNAFYSKKEAIENALEIKNLDVARRSPNACRIITFYNFNFATQDREEAFTWLLQTANKFKNVFSKL